uniref:Uncharacterized protein LOC111107370 isoform X2 n=1 Tax=Crassostrea virginica TaxID=6565 RepID=A0A8B8B4E0_CRAVI|nr:uncharacterized protein LOC111107370 isoform X2 [Crassostrea virginica]
MKTSLFCQSEERRMNIQTKICVILIFSIPLLKAQSDKQELMEREWSVCRTIVKGSVFVAGFLVSKSVILPLIGITSSGIVTGSIAERVYNSLVYTKGLIISKNSFADAFLSKYAGKYGLSLGLSLGKKVYEIVDPYLNQLASYVCE